MEIENFWNNTINKYSFHMIALIFWLFIFIFLLTIIGAYIANAINIELGQVYFWYLLFFFPTIVFPAILLILFFTFLFLKEKEQKNSSFYIKNKLLRTNFYKVFILLSFVLSIISLCISIYFCIKYIIEGNNAINIFIHQGIPKFIFITIIYLIIRKKFLHD